MRKFVLLIIIFIVAGLLVYRLMSDKKPSQAPPPDQALRISKNSSAFDQAFDGLMSSYFALKDALVDWDTLKADQAAVVVAGKADSLPVKTLKADTAIVLTAESLAASIDAEAKGLAGESGIDER